MSTLRARRSRKPTVQVGGSRAIVTNALQEAEPPPLGRRRDPPAGFLIISHESLTDPGTPHTLNHQGTVIFERWTVPISGASRRVRPPPERSDLDQSSLAATFPGRFASQGRAAPSHSQVETCAGHHSFPGRSHRADSRFHCLPIFIAQHYQILRCSFPLAHSVVWRIMTYIPASGRSKRSAVAPARLPAQPASMTSIFTAAVIKMRPCRRRGPSLLSSTKTAGA